MQTKAAVKLTKKPGMMVQTEVKAAMFGDEMDMNILMEGWDKKNIKVPKNFNAASLNPAASDPDFFAKNDPLKNWKW